MSVRGTMFPDRKGHQRALSGVTTQNLSCSEIGTSCEKSASERSQRIKIHQYICYSSLEGEGGESEHQSHSDVGVELQQGSGDVGRQGHVVADSALLGQKTLKSNKCLATRRQRAFFTAATSGGRILPAQSSGAKPGNFIGRKAALAPNGSLEMNTFVNCHLCCQETL